MKEKAVVITGKEKAELVDIENPGLPGPEEILGRTICTLVSPGTELASSYCGEKFPSFPGYAAVARVETIGKSVTRFREGDVFFYEGGHRSFHLVKEVNAVPVAGGLAPEKAVLCRLMGVSMTTLMTTPARPGAMVIISGAGPVGYLASQIFNLSGYDVVVVEPLQERRENVSLAGIPRVFPEMPLHVTDIAGKVALVVECSGNESAVLDACRVVRKRGEVVLVGVPWKRQTDIYAHEILHAVFHRWVVLRSGWEWELPRYAVDFQPHGIITGYETALRWLAGGKIFTEGLISIAEPAEAQVVYQALLHRKNESLFAVFDWTADRGK